MAEWSERKNDEIFYRIANVEDRINGLAARLDKMQKSLIQDKPKESETFHLSASEGFIALSILNDIIGTVKNENLSWFNSSDEYAKGWRAALVELERFLPKPPVEE